MRLCVSSLLKLSTALCVCVCTALISNVKTSYQMSFTPVQSYLSFCVALDNFNCLYIHILRLQIDRSVSLHSWDVFCNEVAQPLTRTVSRSGERHVSRMRFLHILFIKRMIPLSKNLRIYVAERFRRHLYLLCQCTCRKKRQ